MDTALALVGNNRSGQQLGPRGLRTRRRLLDAAISLLRSTSPIDLNAVAIARAAGTSAATFYVYFDDVRELVLALVPDAVARLEDLFPHPDSFLAPERLEEDARQFVAATFAAWDESASVLLFRNLEADRGDAAFDAQRTAWAVPVLDRLIAALLSTGERSDRAQAYADAAVLLAAVERIAATSHRTPTQGPPVEDLRAALVRQICRTIRAAGQFAAASSRRDRQDRA